MHKYLYSHVYAAFSTTRPSWPTELWLTVIITCVVGCLMPAGVVVSLNTATMYMTSVFYPGFFLWGCGGGGGKLGGKASYISIDLLY